MAWSGTSESGKPGVAEHKAAEEAKVDTARHLEQGVEVGHRSEAAEEARQACAAASPQQGKGVQDGAVADEVKNGVDPCPFGNAAGEIGTFELEHVRAPSDSNCSEVDLASGLWQ